MSRNLTAKKKLEQAKDKTRSMIGKKLDMDDKRLVQLFYDMKEKELNTWTPILLKKKKERLIVPIRLLEFTSEDYIFSCGSTSLAGWVPADPVYSSNGATSFALHSLDHLRMPDEVYDRMVKLLSGAVRFYSCKSNGSAYEFAVYDPTRKRHIPCDGCKENFRYDNNEILHASMVVSGAVDWHMHLCQSCYKVHMGEMKVFTPVALNA